MASGSGSRLGPGMGKRLRFEPPSDPEHSSSSSSSSDAEPQVHPWLIFDDQESRDRLEILCRRNFETPRTLCWDTLEGLHLAARAREMIGPVWERFFAISRPTFQELCYEFLATFQFHTPLRSATSPRALTFRMGGVQRELSLAEFAVRMGLYTPEELGTDLFTEAIIGFPQGLSPALYWPQIGDGVYNPKRTKSTAIRDPLLRILHRAVTHSINGRRESTGVVTLTDMLYLYCFSAPATCNVAYQLAYYLQTIAGKRASSSICGGSFVTMLAESYGNVLTAVTIEDLIEHPATRLIDTAVLLHMAVIRERPQGGYQILDGHGQPWPPVQQQQQQHQEQHQEQPGGEGPHVQHADPLDPPPPPPPAFDVQLWEERWEERWEWMSGAIVALATASGIPLPPRPQPQQQQQDDPPPPPPA